MAEEEGDKSFLEKTGNFLWSAFVWDSESSLAENLLWTGVSVASLAAAVPSGGLSLGGVAASAAARTAAKAGLKVAIKEGAEEAVKMTGKAAAKVAGATGRYLTGSTPRWASLGFATTGFAAPLVFNKIENESGGAITQKVIEEAVGAIKEGIKDGTITKENLEDGVRDAISIADMMSSADTMGHTAAVMAAIGKTENPAPEDLQRGKAASIGWIVTHPVMPMTRLMLRAAAAEDLYPDQAERERYIAKGFVEDLISAARIAPLEKHNAAVTEADIKAVLREQKQKGHLDEVLKHCPALERGLNDLYPDLFTAQPAPAATPTVKVTKAEAGAQASVTPNPPVVATPAPQPPQANTPSAPDAMKLDVSGLKGPDLSAAFDKVADAVGKTGGWQATLVGVLMDVAKSAAPLFNMVGGFIGQENMGDEFMRFSLGVAQGAMKSQFGDRFNLDNVKKLVPELKKPEVGLAPAPAAP